MPLNLVGEGSPSTGGNIEQLERMGRRMTMLQQFVPDLVMSTPEGALDLAEGPDDDDNMLRSATEADNFASIQRLRENLENESEDVQRAMFGSFPEPIANAMRDMGYSPPEKEGGAGCSARSLSWVM